MSVQATLKYIQIEGLNAKQRAELRKKLEAHAKELREVVAAIDASLAQLRQAPKTAKRAAKKR